jgi:1,4-dihydroxy-6-naphthoate synthase
MTIIIQLAHSPDADDAFMFYALAKGLLDTEGVEYRHVLKDIQTLNEWAKEGRMEVTALSAHAYAYVQDRYAVLTHGGSIGRNYGPMVVAREMKPLESFRRIAVPGRLTSAFLALKLRHPSFEEVVMDFDSIQPAVVRGEIEAGLLIHEGQLTYEKDGLQCVAELGQWWFGETGLPLPMGVNAIRKDLAPDLRAKVSRHLKQSIQYSLQHRENALDYALGYGRGLARDVADRFVGMWVNDRTVDMGEEGKKAIQVFLQRGVEAGLVPAVGKIEFVE